MEQLFTAESDSDLLKLEKLIMDLQKNFTMYKAINFPAFRVSNVFMWEWFFRGFWNPILKSHQAYGATIVATQHYDSTNTSLQMTVSYHHRDFCPLIPVPQAQDFDRDRDHIHFFSERQFCVTFVRGEDEGGIRHQIYETNIDINYCRRP